MERLKSLSGRLTEGLNPRQKGPLGYLGTTRLWNCSCRNSLYGKRAGISHMDNPLQPKRAGVFRMSRTRLSDGQPS